MNFRISTGPVKKTIYVLPVKQPTLHTALNLLNLITVLSALPRPCDDCIPSTGA